MKTSHTLVFASIFFMPSFHGLAEEHHPAISESGLDAQTTESKLFATLDEIGSNLKINNPNHTDWRGKHFIFEGVKDKDTNKWVDVDISIQQKYWPFWPFKFGTTTPLNRYSKFHTDTPKEYKTKIQSIAGGIKLTYYFSLPSEKLDSECLHKMQMYLSDEPYAEDNQSNAGANTDRTFFYHISHPNHPPAITDSSETCHPDNSYRIQRHSSSTGRGRG